ncbi:MAG TPA: hypothetical protein ENK42_00860 [Deltaproteobacteria bacterium]|nr:hypothetical protein [Deltaproteobacteria bacterium]
MSGLDKEARSSLESILEERFVHSLSELIYDRISTLWHIDSDVERELSRLTATAVCVLFCLEYLSHINGVIKKALELDPIDAKELSKEERLKKLKEHLAEDANSALLKRILPQLRNFVETVEAGNIEEVTQLAHTGDYLLFGLEELRRRDDPEYLLWLESLPHYYKKDLEYLSLIKSSDKHTATPRATSGGEGTDGRVAEKPLEDR